MTCTNRDDRGRLRSSRPSSGSSLLRRERPRRLARSADRDSSRESSPAERPIRPRRTVTAIRAGSLAACPSPHRDTLKDRSVACRRTIFDGSRNARRHVLDPRDHAPRRLPGPGPCGSGRTTWRPAGSCSADPGPGDPRPGGLGPLVPGPAPPERRDRAAAPAGARTAWSPRRVDGFQKLRFRTHDGLAVETVLIPLHKPGAVSVCLSSQVGCAMGCVFCATARMTAPAQPGDLGDPRPVGPGPRPRPVAGAAGHRGRVHGDGRAVPELRPRVLTAAELLCCPYGGQVAAKAITISTVGLVPRDRPVHGRGAQVPPRRSAWARRPTRSGARLVPVAARTPVAEVMAAARRHALARRDRVMLSYVCISGENVGEDDARALGALIGDTPVRLDLIDVTDPTGRFQPPTDREMDAFRDALTRTSASRSSGATRAARTSRPPAAPWRAPAEVERIASEQGEECTGGPQ